LLVLGVILRFGLRIFNLESAVSVVKIVQLLDSDSVAKKIEVTLLVMRLFSQR